MAEQTEILSRIWPEWTVEKLIGRGAFGQVYQTRREERGIVTRAAVKVIPVPLDLTVYCTAENYESFRNSSLYSQEQDKDYWASYPLLIWP